MRGERSKAVRAVKFDFEEDDVSEDSEVSVEYERLEDEGSEVLASIPKEWLENSFADNDEITEEKEKPTQKARPYKVCGGKAKDRKGIMATSFKELVEKGDFKTNDLE